MKLWGRVMSGFMLLMAVTFGVVAAIGPEKRMIMAATALLLAAAGIFGVPALVAAFTSFTGDEDVLASGVEAQATIVSLKPTGWRYNRYYPIVRFCLDVQSEGGACAVEVRQAIDPNLLPRLAAGTRVRVRVDRSDRSKVVIDTRAPIGGGQST